MSDWFAGVVGEQYASAIMWTVGALVLLLVVLLLVRLIRGVRSGTFISGGRNRRPRLAVTDAATVDNNRRLVLVRRDDVEHLLLVGGPSDIVVEQNIRPVAPRPQAGSDEPSRHQQQRYQAATHAAPAQNTAKASPPARPAAAEPTPADHPRRQDPKPAAPAAAQVRQPSPAPVTDQSRTEPAPEPSHRASPATAEPTIEAPEQSRQPASAAAPPATAASVPPPPASAYAPVGGHDTQTSDEEIEAEHRNRQEDDARRSERGSLEDEMSRLLEDISDERK